MSVEVNLQRLPSHILDGVHKQFSKFKVVSWDPTPIGEPVMLHLSYYRNPRLLLSEKALRLTYRHARQNNKPQFTCFLLGTFTVDRDEEGVTLTLDRLDPGREKPGLGGKVSNSSLPGDVVVPCLFEAQHVSSSPNTAPTHHVDDVCASFKMLQQSCTSKETMDVSQLLMLRGWLGCAETSDSLSFSVHWAAITLASMLKATPIKAIPIIPTALVRNLTSPTNQTQPLHTVSHKRGFLTMDQTNKLLLILESDPKAYTLPLVGVWLYGVTHIHSPQVWAWCLKYLHSTSFKERVLSEGGAFLVVLYSLTHREPEFYQCQPTSSQNPRLDMLLLTSAESLTLYKNVEPKEKKPLSFELCAGGEDQDTEFYKEVMARAASGRCGTGAAVAATPQHKLSISEHDSGVEDEDLSPRPSPNPHPAGEQVRQVQPTVPELSLVMDGSFVAGAARSPHTTPPHLPVPTLQRRESVGSPKAHTGLNICIQRRLSASPPISKTAAPTPSSKGHKGPTRYSPSSSSLTSPPKTGALPEGCFGPFSQHPVGGYALDSRPYAHYHPPSPHRRFSGATPAPPLPQLCPIPSTSSKTVGKPCSCCHHHYAEYPPSYQPQPWPETPQPSGLLPQRTPTNPAAVSHAPQSTPPRDCCMSPSHQAPHHGPAYVSHTPPHAHLGHLQQGSHSKGRPSHSGPLVGQVQDCQGHVQGCQGHGTCLAAPGACLESPTNMLSVDAYRILMDQDRQLKLLQAQIQKLLEAQNQRTSSAQPLDSSSHQSEENPVKLTTTGAPTSPDSRKRNSVSVAVGTGASLFCNKGEEEWWSGDPPGALSSSSSSSSSNRSSSSSAQSRQTSPITRSQTQTHRTKNLEEETREDEQNHSASQMSADVSRSLILGESASMWHQIQSAKAKESHNQSADQRFFQDLLGQVNGRLKDTLKEEARSSKCEYETPPSRDKASPLPAVSAQAREASCPKSVSPARSSKASSQSKSSQQGDQVYNATVKHLEKLGVNMASNKANKASVTVESASTLACINPDAVIPRLAVCELAGTSMWAPGCSADLSLEANSIALKYLSDAQLSHLSLKREAKPRSTALQPAVAFLSDPLAERTAASLSILSPTNMSLATQKYMRRYGLIEGADSEEEEEEEEEDQQNGMHHDSALGCSVQMESSRNRDGIQDVLKGISKAPSSTPSPRFPPLLRNQGQVFSDTRPPGQMLFHNQEKNGPRGKSGRKPPSAVENQPPLGPMDTQESVGNFLDLSRLRRLPKLF